MWDPEAEPVEAPREDPPDSLPSIDEPGREVPEVDPPRRDAPDPASGPEPTPARTAPILLLDAAEVTNG